MQELKSELENKKNKYLVMLAPSFAAEFNYPDIIMYLKQIGFDKVVELTFGAKIVNQKYHQLLKKSKELLISSVCPGIVCTILQKYPNLRKNLIPIVSPMIATARICKKIYPKYKIVFISPCNFKKVEAKQEKTIDYVLDFQELIKLFNMFKIDPYKKVKFNNKNKKIRFDKFYNDYTKIYPLAGGLSKTAHLKGIVGANDTEIIDGIINVERFLSNCDKKVKFLDANFCVGGCIGGPGLSQKLTLEEKKCRVLEYVKKARHEKISPGDLGIFKKAKNIKLIKKY